jgi:hypothetical protein
VRRSTPQDDNSHAKAQNVPGDSFGAVRLDDASFTYLHQQDYFQWETYLAFLEQWWCPPSIAVAIGSI